MVVVVERNDVGGEKALAIRKCVHPPGELLTFADEQRKSRLDMDRRDGSGLVAEHEVL